MRRILLFCFALAAFMWPAIVGAQAPAPVSASSAAYAARLDSIEASAPTLRGKLVLLQREMQRVNSRISRLEARRDSLDLMKRYLDAIEGDTASTPGIIHGASYRYAPLNQHRWDTAAASTPTSIPTSARPGRKLGPLAYGVLLAGGAEVFGRIDHDGGGYDRQAFYPKKFVMHYLGGCAIEQLAESAHVPRWLAITGSLAAAVRFEYVQGYPNRRDMANGAAGALSCAAWSFYFR